MKNKDLIKFVIVGILILSGFILGLLLFGKNDNSNNLDINKTSSNYKVDDDNIMNLYYKFNPENELLFGIIGSNYNKENFAYYYKKSKINYKDLTNDIKNIILLNDADYKNETYDNIRNCYYLSKDSFKIIYKKIFGTDDYEFNFSDKFNPKIYIDDNNLCITNKESIDYDKIIDTYMVNGLVEDNYIIVYERVAFIDISDDYLYFYKDYEMKDLVYKLKISDKTDMKFINDSNIVSNVLLKYQDKFNLYEYRYAKGEDSYYFESVTN